MQSRHVRFLGLAMALALVGGSFALAWADSPGPHDRHSAGMSRDGMHGGATSHLLRYFLRHQKDLGLADEQITRLRTMALDQDRAQIRARADVQVAERELRALIWDHNTDLSVIESKVKERAIEAIRRYGTGCAGSRFLNGTLPIHLELERRLADLVGKEAALVFSTGYQTNTGVISCLVQRAHSSMVRR